MARLRGNEWNFAAKTAQAINELIAAQPSSTVPLGTAEPELSELKGARRLDLVIFDREEKDKPLVTGELKLPWTAEGRTPYNTKERDNAYGKAVRAGALYFLTWNVRRVVVWKTDAPGKPIGERVIYDDEIIPFRVDEPSDLSRGDFTSAFAEGLERLVNFLASVLRGPPLPVFLPLDRIFVATIEAALDFPISCTSKAIHEEINSKRSFRRQFERWAREEQGWVVSKRTEEENVERAARFSCYVLLNRLCFYNALRRKYQTLDRLSVTNAVNTGQKLERRLDKLFALAEQATGDYETVFDTGFSDTLPFLSDDATSGWRLLIRQLDFYDFASIELDVIGAMYEQLIRPQERHRYGQHYTQPNVVDLINAFAISTGNATVLDPACGGGTFLVRAYSRKKQIDNTLEHAELLDQVYGCDILNYACHLSTINLAVRDLIDDDNFPLVRQGDFLKLTPGDEFQKKPVRLRAGGLITHYKNMAIERRSFDAIVGNPPYIQSKVLSEADRQHYIGSAKSDWPTYQWRKASDIYVYFWTHAEPFLKNGGILAYLTSSAWLDVEYGIPLQQWMLENFRIQAVMETEAEPWFTGARVATAITILQREADAELRRNNLVRFVTFREPLEEVIGAIHGQKDRHEAVGSLMKEIIGHTSDCASARMRIRVVQQDNLFVAGCQGEQYVGAKWGRFLRSVDSLYDLQRIHADRFIRLDELCDIHRGLTTNCDDFFIVKDVSTDSLSSVQSATDFKIRWSAVRAQVADGKLAIVRRSDGVELPLERKYLRRVMKTARDFDRISTSSLNTDDYFVHLDAPRAKLSKHAKAYIVAGEREGWHRTASFASVTKAGEDWFRLKDVVTSPILFVKTMQYTPSVIVNDAAIYANQRLYELRPASGVDGLALAAVLNSTVVAAERYGAVKALGREAAIDIEVFSAKALNVPDLRLFDSSDLDRLKVLTLSLADRKLGPMLEDPLLSMGHSAAKSYVDHHPIMPAIWPSELRDSIRQEIDEIVLRNIGVADTEVAAVRHKLYTDLVEHTRKLRLLELQAQANKSHAFASTALSPRQLADEVWADLLEDEACEFRLMPGHFLPSDVPTKLLRVPAGKIVPETNLSLFEPTDRITCRVGRNTLEFEHKAHFEWVVFLSELGFVGEADCPDDPELCGTVLEDMQQYLARVTELVSAKAEEVTGDQDLRDKIVHEATRQLLSH